MQVQLLHPMPHAKLLDSVGQLFNQATRVDVAVAFITAPGVITFLRLISNHGVKTNSRLVASVRWPTDIGALGRLARAIPNHVFIHQGYCHPQEKILDRAMMHSKVVYIEKKGGNADILVGSHNWTGNALEGNNLEASVHVRCSREDQFAEQVRHHVESCISESRLFDPQRIMDYKAIQAALHGGPDKEQGEALGFIKETTVIIHAEEANSGMGMAERTLKLYLPVVDDDIDDLLRPDVTVHLYLYPQGSLFGGAAPANHPTLYIGQVEMTNLPSDPVQRDANCLIDDFDRPVLKLLSQGIPQSTPGLRRQVIAVLSRQGQAELGFYHWSNSSPRCRRIVRPEWLDSEQVTSGARMSAFPKAYTPDSISADKTFRWSIPSEPELRCTIKMPSKHIYPPNVDERFSEAIRQSHLALPMDRMRIEIDEPDREHRTYIYRATYRFDRPPTPYWDE